MRMAKPVLAAAAFIAGVNGGISHAQSALPVFDDPLLTERQAIYAKGVRENYDKVILPSLTPQDTARLAGVRLEFPLRIEDAEPMGFATDGPTIFMSTASMAFLDEVAMASAWLQLNGYSQQSLTNYALMLRYGRMEGRTKPPRRAVRA